VSEGKRDVFVVIGDIILDEFVNGRMVGPSTEGGCPIFEGQSADRFLGGAGLVTRHLLRMGATVFLAALGPERRDGQVLFKFMEDMLQEEKSRLFLILSGGRVPQKVRLIVEGKRVFQMIANCEPVIWHDPKDREEFHRIIVEQIRTTRPRAVLSCDNGLGTIDEGLARSLVQVCSNDGIPLLVDSQVTVRDEESRLGWFRGCDTVFLNERELRMLETDDPKFVSHALSCRTVVLKRGIEGSSRFSLGDAAMVSFPQMCPIEDGDPTGAGDAFLAAYAFSGGDIKFANRWAAKSVRLPGTRVPLKEENDEAPAR
jgi:sugar/nucleoside kinase (ribokinase family)